MRVVIDIDEELYTNILNCWGKIHPQVWKSFTQGLVLPKGHGDLVDADSVIAGLIYGKHLKDSKCGEIVKIFDSAIVIHADKEQKSNSLCDTCKIGDTCDDSDKGVSWANHTVCYKHEWLNKENKE